MRFQKRKDKVWRNKRYITLVTQRFRCWENLLVQMLKHYLKINDRNDNDRNDNDRNKF